MIKQLKYGKLKNEEYEKNIAFNHNNYINILLLLEENTFLISSVNEKKFLNLTNSSKELLKSFYNIYTYYRNVLERIGYDKIIICDYYKLAILS